MELKKAIMETKVISIELPVAAWNVVMSALADRPYAQVVGLIEDIKRQAESKLNAPETTEDA